MEEGLGENQPHSRPSEVDRVKYKSPYMRKSFTRNAGIPLRKTIVPKQKHPIVKRKHLVQCLTVGASTSSNSEHQQQQ